MKKSLFPALAIVAMTLLPAAASAVTATTDLDGTLVKGSSDAAVYFYGSDHKRYVFPNDKIFFTWYSDFSTVQTVTDEELAAMPIGGNVTYRPGTKLVKITTDPKVYAVSGGGILRWIMSEELAKSLYGDDWSKQVQDVSDGFFANYQMGGAIEHTDSFNPETERNAFSKISHDIQAKTDPTAVTFDTELAASSTHTIVLTSSTSQEFSWTDSEVSPLGYKFLWSKNENPTFPPRDGDWHFYLPQSSTKSARIFTLEPGTYYVRICVYLGGRCGAYSNQVSVTKTASTHPEPTATSSSRILTLTSEGSGYFSWKDSAPSKQGYKLIWSKNEHPTPTQDGATTVSTGANDPRAGRITFEPGTYFIRVCVYTNEGCMVYSNQLKFVKEGSTTSAPTASSTHTVVLTSKGNGEFSWTNSDWNSHTYRLMWSTNENPVYPPRSGDHSSTFTTAYSNGAVGVGTFSVDPGTFYVRVCEDSDKEVAVSGCGAYSNQVRYVKEAPVTETPTTHTIGLSSMGSNYFSWTDSVSSTQGYRLLWSRNEYPTYPLRDADLLINYENMDARAGKITATDPGVYYVRVCQYLNNACGAYSNQLYYELSANTAATSTTQ